MNVFEWDIYYLKICKAVAENSKCLSRKIGSVLVKNNSIISTGYNGPAAGVKHCNERNKDFYNDIEKLYTSKQIFDKEIIGCPRRLFGYLSGKGLHLCQAGHSERNAIIQAAKNGISTKDATLYCLCGSSCKDCMIEIINAGIKTIVCLETEHTYDSYSQTIAKEAGIEIRKINKSLI
jgi:dCMP deaminase